MLDSFGSKMHLTKVEWKMGKKLWISWLFQINSQTKRRKWKQSSFFFYLLNYSL